MYDQPKKRRCQVKVGGLMIPAWFHGWGLAVIEPNNSAPVNYTVGIAEDNEGNIHEVGPTAIKFNV